MSKGDPLPHVSWLWHSGFFSGCPNQEIGRPFIFLGIIIGTSPYLGADSTTKKKLLWHKWRALTLKAVFQDICR